MLAVNENRHGARLEADNSALELLPLHEASTKSYNLKQQYLPTHMSHLFT